MKRICIHGHFYQPPRENPWLEAVEPQDSAAPYHDWNERVSAECYEPNTAARILDDADRIVGIVNNYGRISFDFGPTLLSWMEHAQPSAYRSILRADRKSRERYSGHGSAMAQAYHHTILPLATSASKRLQVLWGARDFERRFGRPAEGMWLPETAVDLETMECLADIGIQFTVLAPSQAHRVRSIGGSEWDDVSGARVDTTLAYEQRLPSGRAIAVFFYDGLLSRGVAFDGLLHRGEVFADRLASAAPDENGRLAHIATDGESYGHHHPHGDMALAFAVDAISRRDDQTLTNYGAFLEEFPPKHEVEIFERSSWSCAHGVERWRSDCGCHTGGPPGWSQAWRAPLRSALDWLYQRSVSLFSERAKQTFRDPATAVEDYVTLMGDRREETVSGFLREHALGSHPGTDGAPGGMHELKLLELRRQLELMYTSCGWFFNDLAGIETVQILRYAGRAVQLTEDLSGMNVESHFLELLDQAHSNRSDEGTGRDIYECNVRPVKVTWEMLGAHYAIDSFLGTGPNKTSIYCHDVTGERSDIHSVGDARVTCGTARMMSRVTRSSEDMSFVVFHAGGPRVLAGIRRGTTSPEDIVRTILESEGADAPATLREHFGRHVYTLDSLFGDERRRIVDSLLGATLAQAEEAHRRVAKEHGPTIRFLTELGVPVPAAFSAAAAIVANGDLRRAVEDVPLDPQRIRDAVTNATSYGVALDWAELSYRFEKTLLHSATRFFESPAELEPVRRLADSVELASTPPFDVHLWKVQNLYLRAIRDQELTEQRSDVWRQQFRRLGESLSIRLPG